MRVAVYGGAFNPPHVGHAMVAGWVHWVDLADEVWLLPTYQHAFGKALVPFEERVAMCKALGEAVGPWVRVCTIESELPTPSYTIDTLDALARLHPEHKFQLVCGADTLDDTHAWKQWDRIQKDFTPIIAGREGYRNPPGMPVFPAVSSTEIRSRIAAAEDVSQLVPAAVRALLREHYRDGLKPTIP